MKDYTTGYILKDIKEKFTIKRGWFVNAYRIVNEKGEDIIQPWPSTKREAMKTAKHYNIKILGNFNK